jgi:hypothetical protein
MKFCPFSLALFAGSAFAYTYTQQQRRSPKSTTMDSQPAFQVVFVLGGPGAGE